MIIDSITSTSYVVGDELMKSLVIKVLNLSQQVKILTTVVQTSYYDCIPDDHALPEKIKLSLQSVEQLDELEALFESNNIWKEKLVSLRCSAECIDSVCQNTNSTEQNFHHNIPVIDYS